MSTFPKMIGMIGLGLNGFAAQVWAAGGVVTPLSAQSSCQGFECVSALYTEALRNTNAMGGNFTPIHFVLFGMLLIVLRVVGKRLARDK